MDYEQSGLQIREQTLHLGRGHGAVPHFDVVAVQQLCQVVDVEQGKLSQNGTK